MISFLSVASIARFAGRKIKKKVACSSDVSCCSEVGSKGHFFFMPGIYLKQDA